MSTRPKYIVVGDKQIEFYPLPSGRPMPGAVLVFATRHRRVWARDSQKRLLCFQFADFKPRYGSREVSISRLSDDDINAIAALGFWNASETIAAREQKNWADDYESKVSSIAYDVKCLREVGFKFSPKLVAEISDKAARKHAQKRCIARSARRSS